MAELSAPSPITAITLRVCGTAPVAATMSRSLARPHASEMDVPVWPSTKWSCSDSAGLVKPVTEPNSSALRNASARPVSILCT